MVPARWGGVLEPARRGVAETATSVLRADKKL